MIFNKEDKRRYIEGIEQFGHKERVMRGYLDSMNKDGSAHVQCDDSYNGYRGNILYDWKDVEFDPKWYKIHDYTWYRQNVMK